MRRLGRLCLKMRAKWRSIIYCLVRAAVNPPNQIYALPMLEFQRHELPRPDCGRSVRNFFPNQTKMTLQANLTTISIVRNADIGDLNAIVVVTNRAFVSEQFCVTGDRTDAADIRHRFATGIFFVIDDPSDCSRLHGSAFCSVEGSRGYLGLLSVDPDAQGQGRSRILVAAVEQHCRQLGCNFLDITVVNARSDLFPFYARLGFAAFDILPFPVPERARQPLHLVKMTKPLLPPPQMTPPA